MEVWVGGSVGTSVGVGGSVGVREQAGVAVEAGLGGRVGAVVRDSVEIGVGKGAGPVAHAVNSENGMRTTKGLIR